MRYSGVSIQRKDKEGRSSILKNEIHVCVKSAGVSRRVWIETERRLEEQGGLRNREA